MRQKTLHIQTLGALKIRTDSMAEPIELSLTGRARRLWTLVAYLIANRNRKVPAQELIDVLWSTDAGANPLSRLQNNISRVRSSLKELGFEDARNMIVCENGLYSWAPEYNSIVDLDILANNAKEMIGEALSEDDLPRARETLLLYQGNFLGDAVSEPWAVNIAAYYRSLALELTLGLIDALIELQRYEEIERICATALDYAPDAEEFSLHLMRARTVQGEPQRALEYYAHFKKFMRERYDVSPSPAIEAAREEAIQAIHGSNITEQRVRDFLTRPREQAYSFFCSNTTFREITQLNIRAVERYGAQAQLVLMSIRDTNTTLDDGPKRQTMHLSHLRDILSEVLRAGDPITKISSTQLLILLPSATRSAAIRVIERVLNTFKKRYPFARVEITYSLIDIADLV